MHGNTRDLAKTGFRAQDTAFLAAIEEKTDEGERARKAIADGIKEQGRLLANFGQEFGFQYESTAVVPDGSEIIRSTVAEYRPNARPGARAPHSWVNIQDSKISTIDVYNGGFILFTGPDDLAWKSAAERIHEELSLPLKSFALGRDLVPVDETIAGLLGRYGLERTGAVLIRPDGFVGFRAAAHGNDEYSQLLGALSKILDLAGAK